MKRYQELRVDITTDFTIWAIDCSVEEAKEIAIRDLKENIDMVYDEFVKINHDYKSDKLKQDILNENLGLKDHTND